MSKPVLVIQNCPDESPGTILEYLETRNIRFHTVETYQNHPLPNLDAIDAVINLGCPCSIRDYQHHDYLRRLYAFTAEIVRADKPYLGICFGGQMLAKILGAEVTVNPVKEIGTYRVDLTDHGRLDPIFKEFEPSFPVFQWHNDTFKIPFGAQKLAVGIDCENQAFRHGRRIGLQFHLEVDRSEVERWCEVYANELNEVGRTKEQVVGSISDLGRLY